MEQRATQMPVDHVAGDPQPPGNGIRVHLVQPMQDEDGTPAVGQLQYRLAKDREPRADLQAMIRRGGIGGDRQRLGLGARENPPFPPFPAQLVDAEIDRRAGEESVDRARRGQPVGLLGKPYIELVNDVDGAIAGMPASPDGSLYVLVVLLNRAIEERLIVQADRA